MKTFPNISKLEQQKSHLTRHSTLLTLVLLLMSWVWTGCRPPAKSASDQNPSGTYVLVSVNGKQVPCTVSHDGATPTIQSGTFVINPDGTCSSKISFSMPAGGEASREVKASYTRQGSKLTMRWQGAGTTTGTIDDAVFTMNNEGMVFAYRK